MSLPVVEVHITARRQSIVLRFIPSSHKQVLVSVPIKVTGHRHAYVRIVCFKRAHIYTEVPLPVIDVQPMLQFPASARNRIASRSDEQIKISITVRVKKQYRHILKI